MDRKILKLPFTLKSTPDWICPTCQKAPLRLKKGSFVSEEREFSRDHSHDAWEPEWIEYVYSCMLVCTNDKCKEVVASTGTGSVDYYIEEDENGYPDQVYEDHFRPKFFVPHLRLMKIPDDCPESVSKPLNDSFALFFAAPHSASNNIRVAVEALLTELKVRRYDSKAGKRSYISLHRRVTLLPPKYHQLKELMLAIKWLGNAGSHDGADEVSMDDVMDSYELMEHILEEVYAEKSAKLRKLAKKVNKKKGPAK